MTNDETVTARSTIRHLCFVISSRDSSTSLEMTRWMMLTGEMRYSFNALTL